MTHSCADARNMRDASEAGSAALRATLSSTADVFGDWKDCVNRSEHDAYSTILSAASDVRIASSPRLPLEELN